MRIIFQLSFNFENIRYYKMRSHPFVLKESGSSKCVLIFSSESVMDTGKCTAFLKAQILVASAKNQNVKLNRKVESSCTCKQID